MTTALSSSPQAGEQAEQNIRNAVQALARVHRVDAAELALALGLSRASIYNRFGGRSSFSAGEVAAIAEFFQVEVADLYKGIVDVTGPGPDAPANGAVTGDLTRRYPLDNVITLRRPYAAEWGNDEAEVPCGLLTPIGPQRELRMAS